MRRIGGLPTKFASLPAAAGPAIYIPFRQTVQFSMT